MRTVLMFLSPSGAGPSHLAFSSLREARGGVAVIRDGGVMSISRVAHDPSAPDYGGTSPRHAQGGKRPYAMALPSGERLGEGVATDGVRVAPSPNLSPRGRGA